MIEQFTKHCLSYFSRIEHALSDFDFAPVWQLSEELRDCIDTGRQVFICGNGGSGANATHIANDFLYPVTKRFGRGLNVQSLAANSAVITCLANDEGYDEVFSYQIGVQGRADDILVVLSGSGNSPNILKAIHSARGKGMRTYGILGYSGGAAKPLLDNAIHFSVDDMQVCEDLQMIVANMIMQWLYEHYNS